MIRVRYRALGANGTPVEGTVEAESLLLALEAIKRTGMTPFAVAEENPDHVSWRRLLAPAPARPDLAWRAGMVRQLGMLVAAGVPMDRGLMLVASARQTGPGRPVMERVLRRVTEGFPLSSALAMSGGGFADEEIALIRAGEQTGSLVPVLEDTARMLERRIEIRTRLLSALIYPAFLLALAPLSIILIGTVLVPAVAPLFDGNDAGMPLVLRGMIAVSTEFRTNGILWLTVLVAGLAVVAGLRRRSDVRAAIRSGFLRLPVVSGLVRRTEASLVCRTLSSLLRGGTSLQTAMRVASGVAITETGKSAILSAADEVSAGRKLSDALAQVPCLEPRSLQMIATGMETNRLEAMLDFVADNEQQAAERLVERLMTILTPALTIAIGFLVGGIVLSIMRAILSVTDMAVR